MPFARDVLELTLRATKPLRRKVKRVGQGFRIVRHVLTYRPADQRSDCPACGGRRIEHLLPLALERRVRRYGFVSGCRRCGIVFANPLPAESAIARTYSAAGEWGRERQSEHEKAVSDRRLRQLFAPVANDLCVWNPPPGATVLDIGCGLGGMLDAFARFGWNTYGIEPASKVAFTRHRELAQIPSSSSFDLVLLHHVLEHVSSPLAMLREAASALRPGGVLLIGVPNLDELSHHRELKYCIRSNIHVMAYTVASLTWLAADAGLVIVGTGENAAGVFGRRRVVLARKADGPVERPRDPLRAAVEAFGRYRRTSDERSYRDRLPVRLQAALMDLEHAEWRV